MKIRTPPPIGGNHPRRECGHLPDGDTTPAATDHTDFGGVYVAGGTLMRTFMIQNTGPSALTLSGSPLVAVSGANATDFTVVAQPAASMAVGV